MLSGLFKHKSGATVAPEPATADALHEEPTKPPSSTPNQQSIPPSGAGETPALSATETLLKLCREEGIAEEVVDALAQQGVSHSDLASLVDLPPSEIAGVLGLPAVKLLKNRFEVPARRVLSRMQQKPHAAGSKGAGPLTREAHPSYTGCGPTGISTKDAVVDVLKENAHAALEEFSLELATKLAQQLAALASDLPVVGPVAGLLGDVFIVIDNVRCNREACDEFGARLQQMTVLLADPQDGLLSAADRARSRVLDAYMQRFQAKLKEARDYIASFTKAGFLRTLLEGQAPKKKFEEMDAALSGIVSEMGTALSLVQLKMQAQSYDAITDLKEQVSGMGGWDAVNGNPQKLEELAKLLQSDVGTLQTELSSQLTEIRKAQAEMQEKLDDGPQRVITHVGFQRFWARYIRALSVPMDSFLEYLNVYLTDDEKAEVERVEAVLGRVEAVARLKRALDFNANDELTPLELRKAIRCHADLPAVLSVIEALAGQARRLVMPAFSRRSFGDLSIRERLKDGMREKGSVLNVVGEKGSGKTHWLLSTATDLSMDAEFSGDIYYVDMSDASNAAQMRSALAAQFEVRGNSVEEVRSNMSSFLQGVADGSVLIFDSVVDDVFSASDGLDTLLEPLLRGHLKHKAATVIASRVSLPLTGCQVVEIRTLTEADATAMAEASLSSSSNAGGGDTIKAVVRASRGNPGAVMLLCNLPPDVLSGVLASTPLAPPPPPNSTTATEATTPSTAQSEHAANQLGTPPAAAAAPPVGASGGSLLEQMMEASVLSGEDADLIACMAPVAMVGAKFPQKLFDALVNEVSGGVTSVGGPTKARERLVNLGMVVVDDEGNLSATEMAKGMRSGAEGKGAEEVKTRAIGRYYEFWANELMRVNQAACTADVIIALSEFDAYRKHHDILVAAMASPPSIPPSINLCPPLPSDRTKYAKVLAGRTESVLSFRLNVRDPTQLIPFLRGLFEACDASEPYSYLTAAADYLRWCAYLKYDLERIGDKVDLTIAVAKEKLPRGDYCRARFMNYVAQVLCSLGRGAEAMAMYEEAVDVFKDQPVALASSLSALASLQQQHGELAKSRDNFKRAMEAMLAGLPRLHPSTAMAYHNLGSAEVGMSNWEDAKEAFQHAVDIFTAVVGPDHFDNSQALIGIAACETKLGHRRDAAQAYRRAREIQLKHLPPGDPTIVAQSLIDSLEA